MKYSEEKSLLLTPLSGNVRPSGGAGVVVLDVVVLRRTTIVLLCGASAQ